MTFDSITPLLTQTRKLKNKFAKPSSTKWALLLIGVFVANTVSAAAADIFLTLIVLATAIELISTKSMRPFTSVNALTLLILTWTFANIAGYISSAPLNKYQTDEILGLRWVLSIFCCVYAGSKIKFDDRWFTYTYAAVSILVFIALIPRSNFIDNRFFAFYNNPNVLAMAILIPWSFLAGFLADFETKKSNWILKILSLLVLTTGLFATYTRGAWLAALTAFVITIVFNKNKKYLYTCGAVAISIFIMFYFNFFGFAERILYSFDVSTGSSQSLRLVVWKVSWKVFLDHPWFGTGFYESYRLFPKYYYEMGLQDNMILTHSHNQYLQVLVSGGLVGLSAYMTFFLLLIRYFYRSFKYAYNLTQRNVALGALLTIVAYMIGSLVECPLMIHEPRTFLLLVLGGSYGYLRQVRSEESPRLN